MVELLLAERELAGREAVQRDLLRQQVARGDGDLVVDGVAGQLDHLCGTRHGHVTDMSRAWPAGRVWSVRALVSVGRLHAVAQRARDAFHLVGGCDEEDL